MAYCLLDAARMGDAMDQAKALAGDENYRSLYAGSDGETLSHVAPFLFLLQKTAFVDWLLTTGWGQAWGVVVIADVDPLALYQHVKRFLYVRSPDGKALYFRFYDPRALRVFLPTCDSDQLRAFFGPIRFFIVEDENDAYALNFSLRHGQLHTEQLERTEAHTYLKQYLQKQATRFDTYLGRYT